MLEQALSSEEITEADSVKELYRKKYMCSMGPVFDGVFKKFNNSQDHKEEILKTSHAFLNFTYFNDEHNLHLPKNTREIMGLPVWQCKCHITDLRRGVEPSIMLARYHGSVKVESGTHICIGKDVHGEHLKENFGDDGRRTLEYSYTAEVVTSEFEQIFMLLRSLWYHVEARVVDSVIDYGKNPKLRELFKEYMATRKTIIDQFFYDAFPESLFYTKIQHLDQAGLEMSYDKYLFARLRAAQKKALAIAGVIKSFTTTGEIHGVQEN